MVKKVVTHKCLTLASKFSPKYGAERLEKMYGVAPTVVVKKKNAMTSNLGLNKFNKILM